MPKYYNIPVIKYILNSLFFLILVNNSYCQKYIRDSIIIDFPEFHSTGKYRVDTIRDKRDIEPYVLKITEKTKYLYIPVDYYYCLNNSLSIKLDSVLSNPESEEFPAYNITIDYFRLDEQSTVFGSFFKLYSSFSLEIKDETKKYHAGHLIYDHSLPKSFFGKNEGMYTELMGSWLKTFSNDLDSVIQLKDIENINNLYNLKPPEFEYKKNLVVQIESQIGLDWMAVDAELMFMRPEANRLFIQKGRCIRYRNNNDFESLEFGLRSNYLNYRLHKNWLFDLKFKQFLGFNRWKNFDEKARYLEEIFLFDFSLSEHISFNPLDNKSFIFGLGLTQSIYYIINHKITFQPGVSLNIGLKL